MKHILCYGDSNTHGYIPSGGRYDDDTRYTGILAKLLGSDYRIIEAEPLPLMTLLSHTKTEWTVWFPA